MTHRVDRLSRSLLDFAKLMEAFEQYHVAFASVTQHFQSGTSMGRLRPRRWRGTTNPLTMCPKASASRIGPGIDCRAKARLVPHRNPDLYALERGGAAVFASDRADSPSPAGLDKAELQQLKDYKLKNKHPDPLQHVKDDSNLKKLVQAREEAVGN